jgi:hypothetical protein
VKLKTQSLIYEGLFVNMSNLPETKIQIINSFNKEWPDVWGHLFLDTPIQVLLDALLPLGIDQQEIIDYGNFLRGLSLLELLELAKKDLALDYPSPSLAILKQSRDPEVLSLAFRLAESSNAEERAVGLLIIGDRTKECRTVECENLICNLLSKEENTQVISIAIGALASLHFENCLPLVLGFADHKEEMVRESVVQLIGCKSSPEAVAATLKLVNDPCQSVRSWASYLLASNLDALGPEVESVLVQVATSKISSQEEKAEAILGLACRRSGKAPALIASALTTFPEYPGILEAVTEMPKPEYLSALKSLRKNHKLSDYHTRLLDEAIEAVINKSE